MGIGFPPLREGSREVHPFGSPCLLPLPPVFPPTASYAYTKLPYTYTEPSYAYTEPSYAYTEPSYTHTESPYTHTEPPYTHTESPYTHTEPSYTHTEPPYSKAVRWSVPFAHIVEVKLEVRAKRACAPRSQRTQAIYTYQEHSPPTQRERGWG